MECRIVCVVHDNQGVITRVGLEGKIMKYRIMEIIKMIEGRKDSFYTVEEGKKAKVYYKQNPKSGRWFLTTQPDKIEENNLDFLPECKLNS